MTIFPASLLDARQASAAAAPGGLLTPVPGRAPESRPRKTVYMHPHKASPVRWYGGGSELLEVVRPPRWIDLYDALDALLQLSTNWDSYGANPPNLTARASARTVLNAAMLVDVRPSRISPSAEGGVFLSFDMHDRHANIECLNDGGVYAAIREPLDVWLVAQDEGISPTIAKIAAYLESGDGAIAI